MRQESHFSPEKLVSLINLKPGSLGRYAIVPGPKDRMEYLLKQIKSPIKDFSFLDYEMHTGSYEGKKVTTGNGGRYSPDTAISTEILCAGGSEILIRAGSCGALQSGIEIGDLIIANAAVRGEGTTPYYMPQNFPAAVDIEVTAALIEAARKLNVRFHVGLIYTIDALMQETPQLIQDLERLNVQGIDMVTSTFLTVAQVRGKRAGAVLAVSDHLITGQMGFMDFRYHEAEEKVLAVALEAVKLLD
jgi:uridine phosphorylase